MDTNKIKESTVQNEHSNTNMKTRGNRNVSAGRDLHVYRSVNSIEPPPVAQFHQMDSPTPYFTGRKDLLEKIHTRMQACSTKDHIHERIVVLCGLGGIGKSETACMYACEYLEDPIIKNVAWLNCETLTTLEESFNSLAHDLKLPINASVLKTVNCIYKHFSDHIGTGLFIFDDVNGFDDSEIGIQEYLPNSLAFKRRPLILITSRDIKWEIPENNIIAVDELTEDKSVELVTKKLGLTEPQQTDKNKLEILKLAQTFQGFPLGLCIAASNISYRNEEYFKKEVESYIKRMQKPTGGWIKDAQLGAWTKYKLVMENVWDTTLAKIKRSQGGDDALELLNLMVFLPTDGVTVEAMSDLFRFAFGKPVTEKEYFILENKSMLSISKVPLALTGSASTSRPIYQIKIHTLVQHYTREKLDAQKNYSYLQHVCNYFIHGRLQEKEQYSTGAVLCAHEHLKNRKWPLDSICYSVMFCSIMTFFEQVSVAITHQIIKDVYEYLGVNRMTRKDLNTEENGMNLFSLCVLWRNKQNKKAVLSQSLSLTDSKLSAENFKEAFLSMNCPLLKISLLPKMELNIVQRFMYNHCYHKLYESTQMRWSRKIEGFPRKWGHAAVAVGTIIFSIGGKSKFGSSESDSPMDIFVLNLDDTEIEWKPIKPNLYSPSTSTFTPGQRSFHTAVAYGNNIIIFGGFDYMGRRLKSVCRFNIETFEWDEPNVTGALPEARFYHSAVAIQNQMIIFGGRTSHFDASNNVHSLNLDLFVWSNIPRIVGTPPTVRFGHSAVVYENRFIYIFGGWSNEEKILNDVICLDWNAKEWTRPETSGTIPQPRCYHSAFMHKELMYIYGGEIGNSFHVNDLYSFNSETREWRKVKPIGEPPSSCGNFGFAALNDSVYIFGGTKNWRDGLDDTFVLDLE